MTIESVNVVFPRHLTDEQCKEQALEYANEHKVTVRFKMYRGISYSINPENIKV